jgi:hypothetical protein
MNYNASETIYRRYDAAKRECRAMSYRFTGNGIEYAAS